LTGQLFKRTANSSSNHLFDYL